MKSREYDPVPDWCMNPDVRSAIPSACVAGAADDPENPLRVRHAPRGDQDGAAGAGAGGRSPLRGENLRHRAAPRDARPGHGDLRAPSGFRSRRDDARPGSGRRHRRDPSGYAGRVRRIPPRHRAGPRRHGDDARRQPRELPSPDPRGPCRSRPAHGRPLFALARRGQPQADRRAGRTAFRPHGRVARQPAGRRGRARRPST